MPGNPIIRNPNFPPSPFLPSHSSGHPTPLWYPPPAALSQPPTWSMCLPGCRSVPMFVCVCVCVCVCVLMCGDVYVCVRCPNIHKPPRPCPSAFSALFHLACGSSRHVCARTHAHTQPNTLTHASTQTQAHRHTNLRTHALCISSGTVRDGQCVPRGACCRARGDNG